MKKLFLLSAAIVAALIAASPAVSAKETNAKPAQHKKAVKKKAVKPAAKPTAKAPAAKAPAKAQAKSAALPVASAEKPSTDIQRVLTRPGDYRFVVQHDGQPRTYRVHMPQGYNPAEPAPLLVALQGGPSADGFGSLARESDRRGFIAVFPDGYAAKGKAASWNAGACCGDAQAQKVNDVGFIEQVVNNVFKQTSVDRERIYAAGVSDGGMMAYRLACDLPEVFKAVVSVGGTHNTTACMPRRPVSVLHFHAKNDSRVPVAAASATAAKWAELNRCEPAPRRILDEAGAYCEAYTYCQRGTAVQLCVTDGGTQAWPESTGRMLGFLSTR